MPYIYVRSRAEVGEACKTKRPTSCVLIQKPDKKKMAELYESYEECKAKVFEKNPYIS